MHNRIAVRAYYAAEATGFTIDPVQAWLAAERMEIALANAAAIARALHEKRSAAAKRGAATRRANKDALAVRASFQASLSAREDRAQ